MKRLNVSLVLCLLPLLAQGQNSVSMLTADMSAQLLKLLKSSSAGDNLVFSPLSVAVGMGMLHQGAGGKTRRDMADAIGLPDNDQQLRADFRAAIPANSKYTSLNSLIAVAKDAVIFNSYADVVRKTFHGSPFQHTFDTKPGFASFSINQWVQKRSGGKIKQLLPRGSVSRNTKMVLVNVLSYNSTWLVPFDALDQPLPFTRSDGSVVQAKAMNKEEFMGAGSFGGQTVLAVPTVDEETDMVIVYPGKGNSVTSSLMALQTDPMLTKAVLDPSSLKSSQVELTLPKFKLSMRLKLKEILVQIYPNISGMFELSADFSRMAKMPEGILVDEIHHMTVMDVNEKGVEAVGATGATLALKSNFPADLIVDIESPFLVFLVNKKTKSILFAGVVEDPTL